MSAASSRSGSMVIEPTYCRSQSVTVARCILDLSIVRCMAVSGPPIGLYERVVDEPDVADARGDGDQDVPVEGVDGSEGVGVDDGEVLRLDAGLAHRLLAGGAHRRRAVVTRRRGGVEA